VGTGTGPEHHLTELVGHRGWAAATLLPGSDDLSDVDCLSSTFCVVGSQSAGDAFTWDGEDWTRTSTPPFAVAGFSCASTTFCLGIAGQSATVGSVP
jgi:hypothetical protein